jgi:hypothetical protein
MATVAIVVRIVLGLVTNSVSRLIAQATTVVTAIGANKGTFAAPSPALTTVSAAIADLTSKEAAFKAHTGTRADRDDAKTTLVGLMQQLRDYVQVIASANPAQAATIAADAGMHLAKTGAHTKSDLAVKPKVSGTVQVVAKAIKGARAHEWQYSVDGGKTWIDVPATTAATCTITGLTPGVTVSYRHRPITKTGLGDWSQAVTAVVT